MNKWVCYRLSYCVSWIMSRFDVNVARYVILSRRIFRSFVFTFCYLGIDCYWGNLFGNLNFTFFGILLTDPCRETVVDVLLTIDLLWMNSTCTNGNKYQFSTQPNAASVTIIIIITLYFCIMPTSIVSLPYLLPQIDRIEKVEEYLMCFKFIF